MLQRLQTVHRDVLRALLHGGQERPGPGRGLPPHRAALFRGVQLRSRDPVEAPAGEGFGGIHAAGRHTAHPAALLRPDPGGQGVRVEFARRSGERGQARPGYVKGVATVTNLQRPASSSKAVPENVNLTLFRCWFRVFDAEPPSKLRLE